MYAWAQHSRVRPLPLARCLVSTKFAAGNEQAVRARKSCSSEVRFSQNSSALSHHPSRKSALWHLSHLLSGEVGAVLSLSVAPAPHLWPWLSPVC